MRTLAFACLAGLLAACGGGSSESHLQGTWWGPSLSGEARAISFDGGGRVTEYYVDGNPTGEQGHIKHLHGSFYEIYWAEGGTSAFLLGSSGEHAALYVPGDDLMALQRGATNWHPDGYDLPDIAPANLGGASYFMTSEAGYLGEAGSYAVVEADGSFAGEDTNGRIFSSPAGDALEVLDAVRGIFGSFYTDQFHDPTAEMTFLLTPDKSFVVAFANWAPWTFADGWYATWDFQ